MLTPAPAARIGRIFEVDVARPRDREAVNDDAALPGAAQRDRLLPRLADRRGRDAPATSAVDLPNVTPLDLAPPPKAYRDAAQGAVETRYLEFFKLDKVYPTPKGPLTVVEDFNLLMDKGEFVSLIGHSGCGKSTVLTMAAGLNAISKGGIVLDNREIDAAGPDKAVVFQAPSLMPWLTARQNVALGVERVYPHASARRAARDRRLLSRPGRPRRRQGQAGRRDVERHAPARRHRPRLRAFARGCCCSTSRSACSTA